MVGPCLLLALATAVAGRLATTAAETVQISAAAVVALILETFRWHEEAKPHEA